ncbi:MAG TPA: thiamine pyrophosphate-dependent enzyme [Terriglobales bacterium]|nr:thiamine pyrophosphate-dependent enzyme [Terriglobales bacterium]
MCFNPSHLEFVNAVAAGRVRAKQDRAGDIDRARIMGLLIHGDVAFSGEGIVQESLNLSRLNASDIGGALHVVINNQIGFTTSPAEARSSSYATDIAKGLQMPIFHVNGDEPEAVACVVRLALDYRAKFHRDAIIDLYSYRRLGHNEGGEPTFTQPKLYRTIGKHKNVRELYAARLLALKRVTAEEVDERPPHEADSRSPESDSGAAIDKLRARRSFGRRRRIAGRKKRLTDRAADRNAANKDGS